MKLLRQRGLIRRKRRAEHGHARRGGEGQGRVDDLGRRAVILVDLEPDGARFHELLDQGQVAEALIGADRIQLMVKPDTKLSDDEEKAIVQNQPLAARWAKEST
jgi:hypothetical protein